MSNVELRFFAGAAEAAGVSSLQLAVDGGLCVAEVLEVAPGGPDYERVLGQCSVLINGVRCDDLNADLPAGDVVIDVLPPFAGG